MSAHRLESCMYLYGDLVMDTHYVEDDIEADETIIQLPNIERKFSTPLLDFTSPRKTPASLKYPGRGTPRKTGNFMTLLSQYRTPTKGTPIEANTKEGRTEIAIFALEHRNGILFCSVL